MIHEGYRYTYELSLTPQADPKPMCVKPRAMRLEGFTV